MTQDLLGQLPAVSFRGITFPWVNYKVDGRNTHTELTPLNGKGSFIDMVSQESQSISIDVPCFQNLDRGPNETNADYTQLFTKTFPGLIAAMEDLTPGDLIDPIRGSLTVKPCDYSYSLGPEARNGALLTLNFKVHVDTAPSEELQPLDLISTASNFALQYEGVVEALLAEEMDLSNPFSTDWAGAVTGVIGQVNLATLSFQGKIQNTLGQVRKVQGAVTSLENTLTQRSVNPPLPGDPLLKTLVAVKQSHDPNTAPAAMRDKLTDMEYACIRALAAAKVPGKRTRKHYVAVDTLITAVARETKTSVSDLLALNPSLNRIQRGIVPGSSLLTVYL